MLAKEVGERTRVIYILDVAQRTVVGDDLISLVGMHGCWKDLCLVQCELLLSTLFAVNWMVSAGMFGRQNGCVDVLKFVSIEVEDK